MMARWFCSLVLASTLFGSGCCCFPCLNPCGGCCLPRTITWNGGCNECGPGAPCGGCGLWPGLCSGRNCDQGCGEVYVNEWVSDPPDCCDPCDQCHGQFTGNCGPCCLGPAQRILSAFHGYRYCPRPWCGPWKPIFNCCPTACGPACGPGCGCGGHAGEMAYGGEMAHGADVYYEGPPVGHPSATHVQPQPHAEPAPAAQPESTSILDENWDAPRVRPEPGRPMHNARQPMPGKMSYRAPQRSAPAAREVAGRQTASKKPAAAKRGPAAEGVRQSSYYDR